MKNQILTVLTGSLFLFSLQANADPAFVGKGPGCFPWFFPEGGDPVQIIGDQAQGVAVDAGFEQGVLDGGKITCQGYHGKELDNAVKTHGACYFPNTGIGAVYTEDGTLIETPSGNFTLFCHFRREDSSE